MRTLSLLITLVLVTILAACSIKTESLEVIRGSGNVVTEGRTVSGFTAVSLQGLGQLMIDQTGSESLTITADDNFLPYIETYVRGGKLIITIRENTTFNDVTDLIFHVTVKSIDTLELDGAGEIQVVHLDGEEWQANLDGGGSITVSGNVTRQNVQINGLGVYNAEELSCSEATIEHNGAGMAVLQVRDELDVTVNGVGSVEYIGNPTVKETVNGVGSVHKR